MSAINFPKHLKTTDNLNGSQYVRPNLRARAENGDSAMQALRNAHDSYRTFCENLVDAFQKPDPTMTEAAHFIQMREMAFKKVKSAADKNDQARERAAAEIKFCRSAMRSQLEMVENHRAAEIRNYLRTLPQAERSDILAQAVENKDAATIAAVVEAPAYLSGETQERVSLLRSRYETQHNPELAERIADLEQALAINTAAGQDLPEFVDSLLPFAKYEPLKKEQEAAQARRAAISD